MPKTNTISRLPDQPVNTVKSDEWLTVLSEAVSDNLVEGTRAQSIQTRYAVGFLEGDALAHEVNAALAAGPAAVKALDAIAPLFQPGDVVEVSAICPAGGGRVSLAGPLDDLAQRKTLAAFIRTHCGVRNMYFGVNPRDASRVGATSAAGGADVAARRTAFLDFDNKDAPADDPEWSRTIAAITTDANPVLVVASGNGTHIYLPLADADTPQEAAGATADFKAMMTDIGADDMSDLPRIGRLPFTLNLPTASKRQRANTVQLAIPLVNVHPRQGGSAPALNARELRAHVADVKAQHRLPGKPASAANANSHKSATDADGKPRVGQPAPSAEALRMLVDALPNDEGHFDDRDEFVRIAAAIKGAAIAGGCEADGREAFLGFAARWDNGGDPVADEALWGSIANPKPAWGTLEQTIKRINPAGAAAVSIRIADAAADAAAAANTTALRATRLSPLQTANPTKIPPRAWLYGRNTIRETVGFIVAPGGTGKSALTVVEALAMVTGRELLSGDKPHKKQCVWLHNAEDSHGEMQRRIAAAMIHHKITSADIGDRLVVTSGRDLDLTLGQDGPKGPEVPGGTANGLVGLIADNKIDVVIFDPLGAMHTLAENDNTGANVCMKMLREVAGQTNTALTMVHHASKNAGKDMEGAGAAASRGASAWTDAARVVRQLDTMTKEDAKMFLIPEEDRRRYVREDNGKANMAPAAASKWLRLVGVKLNNGNADYPDGDEVQTVERWFPPDVASLGALTPSEMARVQEAISKAGVDDRRSDVRAVGWIGYLIADTFSLSPGAPTTKKVTRTPDEQRDRDLVGAIIRAGLKSGWLVTTQEWDKDARKDRPCVSIGEAVADVDDDAADVGGGDE